MASRSSKNKKTGGGISIAVVLLLFIIFRINKQNNRHDEDNNKRVNPIEKTVSPKKRAKRSKEVRALKTFTGKVTAIKDGDTFEVLYDSIPERVRLAEIDCPEKAQAYGKNAKQFASDLCFGKTVTVISGGKRDRYGRVVGTIVTLDGVNVNEALVKAGYAWHYKDYSDNPQIGVYEQQAREQQIGLWADKNPTAPWDYRRSRRK